jgi:membrane protein DedA with SNARE-associated domain
MVDFHGNILDLRYVLNSIKGGSYFGIFFISLIVSYVLPIPEVVALILIGFAAKIGGFDLLAVLMVSILGTIIGDNILYRLSFFGNKYVQRFNHKLRENKLIQYEYLVSSNIGKAIYFLRFITGVRFFGPVISGSLGVKWKKFFWYNGTATVLHSLLFILMGYYVQHKIFVVVTQVEIVRNVLFFSSVLIVGILLRIFSKKN